MSKSDIKDFILLAIIVSLEAISMSLQVLGDYRMNSMHYTALGITVLCVILFFIKRSLYRYVLGIGLLITVFIPSSFFITSLTFGITFFRINLVSLSLLLLYFLIYKNAIINKLSNPVEESLEESKIKENSKKESFKRKFESLPDDQIEKKLEMNLVNAAKEALLEIQQERRLSRNTSQSL